LGSSALIAGALSHYSKCAAESYFDNSVGYEVIGGYIQNNLPNALDNFFAGTKTPNGPSAQQQQEAFAQIDAGAQASIAQDTAQINDQVSSDNQAYFDKTESAFAAAQQVRINQRDEQAAVDTNLASSAQANLASLKQNLANLSVSNLNFPTDQSAPPATGSSSADTSLAGRGMNNDWGINPSGGWDTPVKQIPNANLPPIENPGFYGPGVFGSAFNTSADLLLNPNSSLLDRGVGLVGAFALTIPTIVEDVAVAFLNAPAAANLAGQYAARAVLADTTDERVVSGLGAVSSFSTAFSSALAPFTFGASPAPALATEGPLQSAEAFAAARETYVPQPGEPGFVGPLSPSQLAQAALRRTLA
jgi:hypothetical protein